MASAIPPKKNAAFSFSVYLVDRSNNSQFRSNPTLAAGDVKVVVDGGAPANITTLPVVDADFTKRVEVSLTAAEMNGDRINIVFSDVTGSEWCDYSLEIFTAGQTFDEMDDAIGTISGYIDLELAEILANSQRVDGLIENVGGDRFTAKALEAGDDCPTVEEIVEGLLDALPESTNLLRPSEEVEDCSTMIQFDAGEKKRIKAILQSTVGTLTIQGTPTVMLLDRSGTAVYGINGINVTGSDPGAMATVRAWYDLDTVNPPTGGPIDPGTYKLCFTMTVLKSTGGTETRVIKRTIKVSPLA